MLPFIKPLECVMIFENEIVKDEIFGTTSIFNLIKALIFIVSQTAIFIVSQTATF